MGKIISPKEQYKMNFYFIKMARHNKCEGHPFYGGDLWTHVDKCEKQIPEPKI